jgi:hypothetical protein
MGHRFCAHSPLAEGSRFRDRHRGGPIVKVEVVRQCDTVARHHGCDFVLDVAKECDIADRRRRCG